MIADKAGARLFGTVLRPLQAFLRLEAASGIVLLGCALVAFAWANLHPQSYRATFDHSLGTIPFRALINDGLMAIFFLVVGMEIKRELVAGELDTRAKAALPAIAAVGGMVLPSAIFFAFNGDGPGRRGWGIPIATDIAFCVGVLALLRDRVPKALVVFVTALAIFDDIGGILVIAVFYGDGLSLPWLAAAGILILLLLVLNRASVTSGIAYGAVGVALWYAVHRSGIHPTIAGVVLGLMIPARPLQRFVRLLHPFVAFLIMPLFALASSGVSVADTGSAGAVSPVALGAGLGLLVGKPLGIFGLTMLAVKLGFAPMPRNASRWQLFGVAVVAGIGFTVALFIAALAYADAPGLLDRAKLGIVLGSVASGLLGYLILRAAPREVSPPAGA